MPFAALLGDKSSHGGTIVQVNQTKVNLDGVFVACEGDLHSCPIKGHGETPIVGNVSTGVVIDGKQVAMTGSTTGCGAEIITTQTKLIIKR